MYSQVYEEAHHEPGDRTDNRFDVVVGGVAVPRGHPIPEGAEKRAGNYWTEPLAESGATQRLAATIQSLLIYYDRGLSASDGTPSATKMPFKIFILSVALLALVPTTAYSTLTALDSFDYAPVGSDLNGKGAGGSFGFSDSWTGQTSYNISSGSLQSPNNPLPAVGNSMTSVAFGDNRGIDRTLSAPLGVEGTSIYLSGLIQPQGILHQGAYGGWFGLALRGSTTIVVGMNYQSDRYGLEVGFEKASSNVQAVIGQTMFFVLRIDFTEGVDPVYLYLNPQTGAPEPASPTLSEINLNVNSITTVSLTGPGANGFDALRIGTTFADVAPPTSDFNGDGSVDAEDLNVWKAGFVAGSASPSQGNADFDNDVDGNDFLIWQRQAGYQTPPLAGSMPVPEPMAISLAACGVLGLVAIRRRRKELSC